MARLEIARDQNTAQIVLAPGERFSGEDEVNALLAEHHVCHGIDHAAVMAAAYATGPITLVIARGEPAREGEDARLELFRSEMSLPDAAAHDLPGEGTSWRARVGDVLGRVLPSLPPHVGKTVQGRIVQPEFPQELMLEAGAGTRLTDDGLAVVSEREGNVYVEGSRFSVRPEFSLDEQRACAPGGLEVDGDLRCEGALRPNHEIRAHGNVLVLGDVDGARLHVDGSLEVRGVIRGGARISATNIKAHEIDESHVRSLGSLEVARNILKSQVEAHGGIVASGTVAASRVLSRLSCTARKLGAAKRVGGTRVVVAGIDEAERGEKRSIVRERTKLRGTLIKISPKIRAAVLEERLGSLTGVQRLALVKLLELARLLYQRDEALAARLNELGGDAELAEPFLNVLERVYPGVQIVVGLATLDIQFPHPPGRFVERDGQVEVELIRAAL